jgi:hypothetical protein
LKEEEISSAWITGALVVRTSFKDFDRLVETLKDDPNLKIVYVKTSLKKLFIKEEESENNEPRRNNH